MRLCILHTRLAPYFVACLRELVQGGADVMIYVSPGDVAAPFDRNQFAGIGEIHNRSESSRKLMLNRVKQFKPDTILVAGWADRDYLTICRVMRQEGVPVVSGCDTQWRGDLRQLVAAKTARFHIRRAIDVLWVTGERQATLARALGYQGDRLWDGYYACDWEQFGGGNVEKLKSGKAKPHFLYVGRYVDVKGINVLVEAYRCYCERVEEPWGLKCAGAGPLQDELVSSGAEDLGFVQPDVLPEVMGQASAFVLPSRFEPWGVVVQEAAASGLPLICSDACGAAVHLLRDGFNGYSFPTSDKDALVDRMVRMTEMKESKRNQWGKASFELSKQYTPERWVETLISGVTR